MVASSSSVSVCTQNSSSERRAAELEQFRTALAQRRKEEHKMVAHQIQENLGLVKAAAKKLLSEVGNLLEANERVESEYQKALQSQREEELRLADMEPDVNGATDQYGAHQPLVSAMMGMRGNAAAARAYQT